MEQIKNGVYAFQNDEQEDAIRNIKGRIGIEGGVNPSGPFYNESPASVGVESWQTTGDKYIDNAVNFDLTKADEVNVAEENRSRNLTFTFWVLIKNE